MTEPTDTAAAIKRLAKPRTRGNANLVEAKTRNPIKAKTGDSRADPDTDDPVSGLRPPFTEDDSQREYWDETDISSSSGAFVIVIKPFKKRVFTDAAGVTVTYNYPEPT